MVTITLCARQQKRHRCIEQSFGLCGRGVLLQCTKVKSESEVAQSCPTPSDPMDCSLPGSSIHGIFQGRVLEWGAIAFSTRTHRRQKKKQTHKTWLESKLVLTTPRLLPRANIPGQRRSFCRIHSLPCLSHMVL